MNMNMLLLLAINFKPLVAVGLKLRRVINCDFRLFYTFRILFFQGEGRSVRGRVSEYA